MRSNRIRGAGDNLFLFKMIVGICWDVLASYVFSSSTYPRASVCVYFSLEQVDRDNISNGGPKKKRKRKKEKLQIKLKVLCFSVCVGMFGCYLYKMLLREK